MDTAISKPPRPPAEPGSLLRESPVEVIQGAAAEMESGNWENAARGFLHAHLLLQGQTPRPVFAAAATCLHRLGKFAAAEEMAGQGLGAQRDLIAVKSEVPPEAALLRSWRGSRAPLVSIVCMAYNHERYIENTLRGFLGQQTDFPFEVLIHDDASRDGTQAVIRRWQEKYPTLIRPTLQSENQFSRGVRPFELLLSQARGRYVATCEGDDYWLQPAKLQKQVGFLETHPDFSCSAHNYYLYNEARLAVRPWLQSNAERVLSGRQLMGLARLLWLPTLVFRKTFAAMPPERAFAPIGDQFLTSYLGTFGKCMYFENFLGAVRRENQYSQWTPLSDEQKELIRVKTWLALVRMHETRGNAQAVADLRQKIAASSLPPEKKSELIRLSVEWRSPRDLPAAV